MEDIPLFRAPKRRKLDNSTSSTQRERLLISPPSGALNSDEEPSTGTQRIRRPIKPNRTGVLFTSAMSSRSGQADQGALIANSSSQQQLEDITGRFVAPNTGQKIDVDEHMLAYVDSEIAKRRQAQQQQDFKKSRQRQGSSESSSSAPDDAASPKVSGKVSIPSNARAQHQLSEVSLPPREPTPPPAMKRTPKPRLDRYGRPRRPRRGPRRRLSEDIARDALVDAFLHENKLEHYQQPLLGSEKVASTAATNADVTALGQQGKVDASEPQEHDDDFAMQFQQDFEDRMADRRRAKKDTGPQKPVGKSSGPNAENSGATAAGDGADKKSALPRMGGSRNARIKLAKEKAAGGVGGGATK